MSGCNTHPPALWNSVRKAYEGRDPARQTSNEIRVESLAAAFGIHPNSIFGRSSAEEWARPGWYTMRGRPDRRPGKPQQRATRLLAVLRQTASQGLPCPTAPTLAAATGLTPHQARELVEQLVAGGSFTIERRNANQRRMVFPDGSATDWTTPTRIHAGKRATLSSPPPAPHGRRRRGIPDLCARDAVQRLQRTGCEVFDAGVHDGRWGERWSVDGKMVDRAGLLQEAAAP